MNIGSVEWRCRRSAGSAFVVAARPRTSRRAPTRRGPGQLSTGRTRPGARRTSHRIYRGPRGATLGTSPVASIAQAMGTAGAVRPLVPPRVRGSHGRVDKAGCATVATASAVRAGRPIRPILPGAPPLLASDAIMRMERSLRMASGKADRQAEAPGFGRHGCVRSGRTDCSHDAVEVAGTGDPLLLVDDLANVSSRDPVLWPRRSAHPRLWVALPFSPPRNEPK